MIIAVDFDGTLCEDRFPEIGAEIPLRVLTVKHMQQIGIKTILWTCRDGKPLENAIEWCKKHYLKFDAVNENLPEIQEKWGGDTRKIYCDHYIDDKNLDWADLYSMLLFAENE